MPVAKSSPTWSNCDNGWKARCKNGWKRKSTTCKPIVIGWTTERPTNGENHWGAERWNQHADNTKPASSGPGSFGVKPAMKHSCAWKHSDAMNAGTFYSLILKQTPPKTDLRPQSQG